MTRNGRIHASHGHTSERTHRETMRELAGKAVITAEEAQDDGEQCVDLEEEAQESKRKGGVASLAKGDKESSFVHGERGVEGDVGGGGEAEQCGEQARSSSLGECCRRRLDPPRQPLRRTNAALEVKHDRLAEKKKKAHTH